MSCLVHEEGRVARFRRNEFIAKAVIRSERSAGYFIFYWGWGYLMGRCGEAPLGLITFFCLFVWGVQHIGYMYVLQFLLLLLGLVANGEVQGVGDGTLKCPNPNPKKLYRGARQLLRKKA